MERLRALEGRAAHNMMELENIKTRVRDTFEYYEDGGSGDDWKESESSVAGRMQKQQEGGARRQTNNSMGNAAERKTQEKLSLAPSAKISKRPSFIRGDAVAGESKDRLRLGDRMTITSMFEDFEKRSPVLAAMLEEVQASTSKAHTVLESLSNALERRQL